LSHQFPAVVVVAVVVGAVVRVGVGVDAGVDIEVEVDVNVDVVVGCVGDDLAQDESIIAVVIKILTPSQITFFFTLFLQLINYVALILVKVI